MTRSAAGGTAETGLTKANVSRLGVVWSTKLSTPPTDIVLSTLTAPVGIAGVAIPQGAKDMFSSRWAPTTRCSPSMRTMGK